MDEAKKRLRICLLLVVIAAIAAGCIYYIEEMRAGDTISDGTLVRAQMEGGETDGFRQCDDIY